MKLNYNKSDKEHIEKSGRYEYYDFTEQIINEITKKDFEDVTYKEWCILIQMVYPQNLIASGLFQPFLVFKIDDDGQRVDPPKKDFDDITSINYKSCLLLDIMDILESEDLKCHASWYIKKAEIKIDMINK